MLLFCYKLFLCFLYAAEFIKPFFCLKIVLADIAAVLHVLNIPEASTIVYLPILPHLDTLLPLVTGIGYASCFMAYIVAFYYNVVIGWAFYYLFSSFTLDLPWRHCDREWNSPHCWKLEQGQFNATNQTYNSSSTEVEHSVSSSYEFFE